MTLTFIAAIVVFVPAWKLVWQDEFKKPGRPDPKKWSYETGFVRNDEAQFYTKDRPENARVEDGHLVIEARKDNFEGHPISSASLTTDGLASWKYGKVEVRAKIPTGRGTWPAIWMLGSNIHSIGWPRCGEIDIMENVGYDPDRIHFNIHVPKHSEAEGSQNSTNVVIEGASEGWHIYSMEWFPDRIDLFLDGKLSLRYLNDNKHDEATWPFDNPQYLILNLAIGGAWGGQQGIDESIFPAKFLIDYVRVYRQQ